MIHRLNGRLIVKETNDYFVNRYVAKKMARDLRSSEQMYRAKMLRICCNFTAQRCPFA